jgi:hypothetical protein
MECNKSFSEIARERFDFEYQDFFKEKNKVQLIISAAFSAAPFLAPVSEILDDIERIFVEQVWGGVSAGVNGSIEGISNGASPGNLAAGATSAFTEAALGTYLTRIFAERVALAVAASEGAPLIAAAAPIMASIAAAVAAFIAATALAFFTKIVVQATADYLAQTDEEIERLLLETRQTTRDIVANMPRHEDYIAQLCRARLFQPG